MFSLPSIVLILLIFITVLFCDPNKGKFDPTIVHPASL